MKKKRHRERERERENKISVDFNELNCLLFDCKYMNKKIKWQEFWLGSTRISKGNKQIRRIDDHLTKEYVFHPTSLSIFYNATAEDQLP